MTDRRHIVKVTVRGWEPADPHTWAAHASMKRGSAMAAEFRQPRNLAHHNKFWALCDAVSENHPTLMTAEDVCEAIKLLIGHTRNARLDDGTVLRWTKSISFGKMDQVEFEKFYAEAERAVLERLLPGIDSGGLSSRVADLLGMGTAP